ncbi:MAG: DNA photolyase family protein [Rickettsiales bacterium]|jgi:deoxyribodipyrimidine photo-lyase|nr:DNA photolyase family protein [Rickettsiales bacterium]
MISFVWLRRDLRLYDHAALFQALASNQPVQLVFVFDEEVLKRFPDRSDRRLSFLAQRLCYLENKLKVRGGGLLIIHGKAREVIPKIVTLFSAAAVHAAEDYEPPAIQRDKAIKESLGACFKLHKDQLIFDPREVVKEDGSPFKVYTPFSKAWISKATPASYAGYDIQDQGRYADVAHVRKMAAESGLKVLDPAMGARMMLSEIGYNEVYLPLWPVANVRERLGAFISAKVNHYATKRDIMADEGTSRLSPYLRFGFISVRECARAAYELAQLQGAPKEKTDANYSKNGANKWLSELIWREFYAMILYHYPESMDEEWNPAYRGKIAWSRREDWLAAWKEGMTGFPLIDAAMRELKTTGWMHNRARMVVASFLTKDLQIDWRLGEAHFAQLLMDYEMASNVGGWQWAASTGTDAQPYFRIFNPYLQSKKFDPNGAYIRRYVPELAGLSSSDIHEPGLLKPASYPSPIVDHADAREKTLALFKNVSRETFLQDTSKS